MKKLFIDPIAGVAGDMLCSALLDLGMDAVVWQQELKKIELSNYNIEIQKCMRGSFSATHLNISPQKVHKSLEGTHTHIQAWDHDHRHYSDIVALIDSSTLSEKTKTRSKAVFEKLARAEGKIHNIALERVHFHEVGAVDSILDIVGFCIGLELLDIDAVYAAPPPLSVGTTKGAHGTIPLPAPATIEVLKGRNVRSGFPGREQSTPTGAAILAALSLESEFPSAKILCVGYGAGTKNPNEYPNLLRAIVFEKPQGTILQLDTQIDDMTGEELPLLFERCLKEGALDVFAQPILMKKGRSGFLLSVLTRSDRRTKIENIIFENSSTFGIRYHCVSRTELERRRVLVHTKWGKVHIKIGQLGNREMQASVEYEDAASIAKANKLSIRQVMNEALYQWRAKQ